MLPTDAIVMRLLLGAILALLLALLVEPLLAALVGCTAAYLLLVIRRKPPR